MSQTYWRCDKCGCTGSSFVRGEEGVWTVADSIVYMHRSISETCPGGANTIRVSDKPIKAKPARCKK